MMRSVALRLTLIYLSIIMALSIGFSVLLYKISSRELAHSFPSKTIITQYVDPSDFDFNSYRQQRIHQSEDNLKLNLVLLNVGTLLFGAVLSYEFARRTLQPIEEAFEAQGRFTADASHELRTPLTAMQTSIEVGLRNPELTLARAKTLLGDTLDEVKKLSALSNGLLKLTRSGGGDMPKTPVQLNKIATEAVNQLELAASNKRILIKNDVGKEQVLGDHVSLKELVVILLDNAIKYSGEQTTITLSSKRQGRFVYLSVSDQGVGMKAIDMAHIFDRFYRADQSRSRDHHVEGYGLGLSIAQKIAEAHSGSIEVKSKLGEGSTFTVKLPELVPLSSAIS
ncbi:MAG TPA: HAMP domain-containing sensor histidine kinase [Candidatus Saccharimonadales bacterium]